MKKFIIPLLIALLLLVVVLKVTNKKVTEEFKISKTELINKIKGGWAGQAIGVCYALPTEFRYKQKMIPDSVKMELTGEQLKQRFNNDDIYMDAKFIEVIGRLGIDAPVDSFAIAFANAGFRLWHANQAVRYNILNGIMPPESGHWKYSMHSDDIDFQIESDFAGLTSAGVLDAAVSISDKVGHIMNYGDGWYSGVYVAGMYSLAFISDDIDYIVNEALKLIPGESKFCMAMNDVIEWHKKYPDDWTKTWNEIENSEWSFDLHCPGGVFTSFNIDANVNMAYVLVGLLYGNGDFTKSMDISMRCGQDSDCNPSSVGGILGTIIGYDKIPEKWLSAYKEIENTKLNFTSVSLTDCYDICYKSSLDNILKYGGKVEGDEIIIKYNKPKTLPLEVAYPDLYPTEELSINKSINDVDKIEFTGTGIVVLGGPSKFQFGKMRTDNDYIAQIKVSIDGKPYGVRKMPYNFHSRALEVFFNLELSNGKHTLELEWLNPVDSIELPVSKCLIFSGKLVNAEN
jgi:ADP-ribosylglycohydrolase